MDLPARARPHLLLRVLLADFSDSPTEWPTQNSSGIRISGGRFTRVRGGALLVRTDVAMVFEWLAHADGAVLGWYRGCPAGSCKCVAGRYVGGCFACFPSAALTKETSIRSDDHLGGRVARSGSAIRSRNCPRLTSHHPLFKLIA